MNIRDFFSLIGKKKQTIASLLVIFLAAAIIFSAASPFKYNSHLTLLTVHNFSENTDPYVASRSNEYLSDLLARIISSGSFFAKVKESGFNFDKNYFSGDEKKQMKKWNKTVKAKSIADTGMIAIDVYHADRVQAEEIARAVAYTLQSTNSQYHGFGNNVSIKIIDEPLTSNYPVQPNIIVNLAVAVVLALIFSLCYIYVFPASRYDIRLWPKREFKEMKEENFIPETSPVLMPEAVREIEEEMAEYPKEENVAGEYRPEDFYNSGSMNNVLR